MTDRTKHGAEGSVTSAQLAEILDKLVAVDLDLEPICRIRAEGVGVSLASARDAIAGACDILRSAIGDLRDIIHKVDGLKYLLPAVSVHQDRPSAVAQASVSSSQPSPDLRAGGVALVGDILRSSFPNVLLVIVARLAFSPVIDPLEHLLGATA
jgi:hypothetical protein